jgi:hypothetical protein|tara:strand:+ start:1171 stop:1398 length:228 start_codon:yes stop_codon:yes gene_type:complete
MNSFISNLYQAKGSQISGEHNGFSFLGNITDTRCKYGTEIQVTVEDTELNQIFLIDGSHLFYGNGGGYSNLHVYF